VPDGQIAATALEHDLTVVTRNVREFAGLGVNDLQSMGHGMSAVQLIAPCAIAADGFPALIADAEGGRTGNSLASLYSVDTSCPRLIFLFETPARSLAK
jgi:hypothetical protein